MGKFEEYDYCMRRKCKNCKIDNECGLLNGTLRFRLMWQPFENLDKTLEEKTNDTKDSTLHLATEKAKKVT